jgi:hypothetical protein
MEKVKYYYPSGLEKTLCKWDIGVPLVTKGLIFVFTLIGFLLITTSYFYTFPSPYSCSSIFQIFFRGRFSLLGFVPPIQSMVQALFLKLLRTTHRLAQSNSID